MSPGLPGEDENQGKGHEVGSGLVCSRNSKKASVGINGPDG